MTDTRAATIPRRESAALWSTLIGAAPTTWKGTITILGVLLFVLFGLVVASQPSMAAVSLAVAGLLLIIFKVTGRMGIEAWQIITLLCLTGYVVLNYGFENLSMPLGPLRFIPVGELLMATALIVAVLRCSSRVFREILHSPPILCILVLLFLTLCHLVVNIPDYGLYAIRDGTSSFEALFVLLGILWAEKESNIDLLTKWLMFLFVVTAIYSYTFTWAEQLQARSLISGPFHPVALLGNYQDIAVYLLAGALFCLWVAPSIVKWPSWFLGTLAITQLAGLGIVQSRTMYVGIALILLLLVLLHETGRVSQFLAILAWAMAALILTLVLLSAGGWKMQGRLGPVDFSSLTKEVKSIWPTSAESVALGHESDRRAWYGEVWNNLRSSPTDLLIGVGYGQPLINFISDTGQPVRQPHNSSLNVFGRLGFVGLFIWMIFVSMLLKRLWSAVRENRRVEGGTYPFHLWLLAFSILGLLDSMVQPYFEFSHSAVPFFFLMGVGLGMRQREDLLQGTPIPMLDRTRLSLRRAERDGLGSLP